METMCARTASGRKVYVDPADPRAISLVAAGGDLNPGSLALWRRALCAHPWQVVVDVGVNYGEMLVDADLPEGAEVIGFEPNTALHPFLERTLREAGVPVLLRAEAIADRVGSADFVVDETWSGTSSLATGVERDGTHAVTVPVTTLDAVLGVAERSFCAKVDVEGFEREVVAGADGALRRVRHWALMLEVLHMPRTFVASLAERFVMLLQDRRTGALLRVPGGNAMLAERLLAGRWLYPNDCLVVSDAVAELLLPRRASCA